MNSEHLCYHITAKSKKRIKSEISSPFVRRMVSLFEANPRVCVSKMKELSLIIKSIIDCSYNYQDNEYQYWKTSKLTKPISVCDYTGNSHVLHTIVDDPFVKEILLLQPSEGFNSSEWIDFLSSLLKTHTLVTFDKPSQSERDAIFRNIASPTTCDKQFFKELEPQIRQVTRILIRGLDPAQYEDSFLPIWAHTANPNKYSFCITSTGEPSSSARSGLLPYNINYMMRHKSIQDLYKIDPDRFISLAFTGVRGDGCHIANWDKYPLVVDDFPIGKIVSISEPGGKFRVVNQPHLLINSLSYQLGLKLKQINTAWSVQGVDSHVQCVQFLQEHLRHNLECNGGKLTYHSIDMANFTDRLPYKGLQDVILDELVKANFIDNFDKHMFDMVCRSNYHFLKEGTVVSYGTGTPQGTNPSFPLCSLANGVILFIATLNCYGKEGGKRIHKNQLPGRIIGDDTVIWDDSVALEYKRIMARLGVEISPSKTITSKYMIEMCSKVVHQLGIFEQKKLKPIDSLSSFISNFNYYGEDIVQINAIAFDLLEVLRKIPKPYGLGDKHIKDIFLNAELTPYEQIALMHFAISTVKDYIPSSSLKREDLRILFDRYALLPEIIIGKEVERGIDKINHNKLVESIYDMTLLIFKRFKESKDQRTKCELSCLAQDTLKGFFRLLSDYSFTEFRGSRDSISVPRAATIEMFNLEENINIEPSQTSIEMKGNDYEGPIHL